MEAVTSASCEERRVSRFLWLHLVMEARLLRAETVVVGICSGAGAALGKLARRLVGACRRSAATSSDFFIRVVPVGVVTFLWMTLGFSAACGFVLSLSEQSSWEVSALGGEKKMVGITKGICRTRRQWASGDRKATCMMPTCVNRSQADVGMQCRK